MSTFLVCSIYFPYTAVSCKHCVVGTGICLEALNACFGQRYPSSGEIYRSTTPVYKLIAKGINYGYIEHPDRF